MKILNLVIFTAFSIVIAQHQTGIKTDRYGGINVSTTSPTSFLDNPLKYDVNIISTAAAVNTNYVFYSDASVLKLLNNIDSVFLAEPENGITGDTRPLTFDFKSDINKKFVFASAEVLGPSANFKLKNSNVALGIFTRARVAASGTNIDNGFNYYNFADFNYGNIYNTEPSKLSGMAWLELGFNYAKTYKESWTKKINIGANIKYLIGLEGTYIKSRSDFAVRSQADSITFFGDFDIETAYTEGLNAKENYEFNTNGSGIGVDLGVSIVNKERYGFKRKLEENYTNKWDFNLLDLGFVRFKNAYVHNYRNQSANLADNVSFIENSNTIQDITQDLSFQIYGDSLQSQINDKFIIGLPTALNVKHDRKFKDNIYVNYQIIQRVPILPNSIKRANLVSVTPRFEKRWLTIAAPLSLFDYRRVQLGSYFRIGPFHIGTDNFLPFFFKHKRLDHADIYFGLKFNPFWGSAEKRNNKRDCNCF